ncbi:hypothetical protein E1287_36625 [Actinomadura sp. KC06]|uniref:hypothetical protein n=1 Tax=Actinomadura sp. KC06 TaxID=2530369 RepID=UPI001043CB38|nr:hypothetical protein [Actinomadura sp. KC06]TDD26094.1 hypothetical protein E1287_36625 [Actinomadura sp. KC06]
MTDPAPPLPDAGTAPPPSPPRHRRRRTLVTASGYAAFVVLLLIVVLDSRLHRFDKIGKVHQRPAPANSAGEHGLRVTYYAGLIHDRSRVFGRHQSYDLYTGSRRDLSYGHFVHLDSLEYGKPPVIESANWTEEGVRVTFTSGHEVFVPARYYVGGR